MFQQLGAKIPTISQVVAAAVAGFQRSLYCYDDFQPGSSSSTEEPVSPGQSGSAMRYGAEAPHLLSADRRGEKQLTEQKTEARGEAGEEETSPHVP